MSDDLPFKAEYAKSGRAACKACKASISKDSLRLAKMVQSPHFDGKMPHWFHLACFFKKNAISSQGDVDGFDGLRWDDQQTLKQRIAGGGGAVGGSVAAPSGKMAEKMHTRADLEVEYSKSGRAKCRGCFEPIPKDEVRIAKMEDPDPEESYSHGQRIPRWHHVDCFVDNRESLGVSEDVSADMLTGFKTMKKADQEMLCQKLGGGEKKPAAKATKGKKRKAEDEVDGGAPLKKVKSPAEEKEEKDLKVQSEFVWKIRDKLNQFVHNNGLKELLEENIQDIPSGESRLLDRCSDILAFGALERCGTCKTGQFVLRGDLYACTGNLTEWTKCQETTVDPKRFKPTIPAALQDIEYLKIFKFKTKKRIFPKLTAMASSGDIAVASASQASRPADKPFQDLKFGIIGKLKGTAARIAELGGKVTTKTSADLFCIISTEDEVRKMSARMLAAEAAGVPVMDEDYVEDAAAGAAELKFNNHKLAPWGLKKHLTKSSGAVKSVGKRSAGTDAVDGGAAKKMKISIKGAAAVDPASGLEDACHVLEEKGDIFSATLGMVDIQRGTNSFYKLQVLEQDKGARWHVFRSWGRVGTSIGGNKTEPYHSRENAKSNFIALYGEKTGNAWVDRKQFVKVVGKFYPLEIDYGQDDADLQKMKRTVAAGSKSTLAKPVQDLVQLLFDIESMQNALVEFEIDMKKMPLGKLSKRQIDSAYSVLNEALKEMEGAKNATRLLDASNRFYTLIPHDFGMLKPPLLDNEELIQSKCTMLDSLLEIEIAYSLLKQGDGSATDDPVDINYRSLKTEMEVLPHDHAEFDMIKKFVANTHASTHNQYELEVLEVFKVERDGESGRFEPFEKDKNRMLLWHGSRTTNFCGILSQGLRIAPPEAPVTGYMFGKGIYFADMVSKSANYCRTTPTNSTGLMLLCEVALGDAYELTGSKYVDKLPKGKLSTKGIGRTAPDPSGDVVMDNGCVVPMGKGGQTHTGQTSLLYNEFIVYDVSQISMKYLLKLDFKYKSKSWF